MCDRAMTELNHIAQTAPPIVKTHPCATCFVRGLEEKAKKTKEAKERAEKMDES